MGHERHTVHLERDIALHTRKLEAAVLEADRQRRHCSQLERALTAGLPARKTADPTLVGKRRGGAGAEQRRREAKQELELDASEEDRERLMSAQTLQKEKHEAGKLEERCLQMQQQVVDMQAQLAKAANAEVPAVVGMTKLPDMLCYYWGTTIPLYLHLGKHTI